MKEEQMERKERKDGLFRCTYRMHMCVLKYLRIGAGLAAGNANFVGETRLKLRSETETRSVVRDILRMPVQSHRADQETVSDRVYVPKRVITYFINLFT